MLKRINSILIMTILLCLTMITMVNGSQRFEDNTQSEIDNINYQIEILSQNLPDEGLYYYQIRSLIDATNMPVDKYEKMLSNPECWDMDIDYWKPHQRRITVKDIVIKKYCGSGTHLSREEYEFATDFSNKYICKTEGDMICDAINEGSELINYYINNGVLNCSELNSCYTFGIGGYRIYVGNEVLKNIILSMPQFNKEGLLINENGYYTNFISKGDK